MGRDKRGVKWLEDVAEKDYAAALSYLTLKLNLERAEQCVHDLRETELQEFRANDILRAAGLTPAPRDDPAVKKNLHKIGIGVELSPILLVNLEVGVDVADGYHRVSAVYYEDPDTYIPGRLAELPSRHGVPSQ